MTTRRKFLEGAVAIGGVSLVNPKIIPFNEDIEASDEDIETKFIVAQMPLFSYETIDDDGIVTVRGGFKVTGYHKGGTNGAEVLEEWRGEDYRGHIPCNEMVVNPRVRIKEAKIKGYAVSIPETVGNGVAQLSDSLQYHANELIEFYIKNHGKAPKYIILAYDNIEVLPADEPKQLKFGWVVALYFGLMACNEIPNELDESYVRDSIELKMRHILPEGREKAEELFKSAFRTAEGKINVAVTLRNQIYFV